jgi:hypothetical protein
MKTDDRNTTARSKMGGKFTAAKNWNMLVTFSPPEFNVKKQDVA